jgi:hypothetical protein
MCLLNVRHQQQAAAYNLALRCQKHAAVVLQSLHIGRTLMACLGTLHKSMYACQVVDHTMWHN